MTASAQQSRTLFVSLRWRFLLPVFIVLLVAAMIGAYLLGDNLKGTMEIPQLNLLLESSRVVSENVASVYEHDRSEAERIAFTRGVPEMITSAQTGDLQPILESAARLGELDSVIVTDVSRRELLGLLAGSDESDDYSVSTGTDLSDNPIVQDVFDGGYVGATGLVRTPNGLILYTGVPVRLEAQTIGVVIVGRQVEALLEELGSGGVAALAIYGEDGALLQTTLDGQTNTMRSLQLPSDVFQQSLTSAGQNVTVQNMQIGGAAYQAAYLPFQYGPNILGVFGIFVPDSIPFLSEVGRQLTSLVLAVIAGVVIIGVFLAINTLVIGRTNRITQVAQSLAEGNSFARTGMKAGDEIGVMGQALDLYADYAQNRQDALRVTLRRQRREAEHLMAVLESMPDGIVVQDLDGRVLLMNEQAKHLLGSQRVFRSTGLGDLTAIVTDTLGAALAPGLYSLGDPLHLELDGRMLSAQAAAVVDLSSQRVGTVIVLRDITDIVRRERAHEALVKRVEQEIERPLNDIARAGMRQQPMSQLARELSRHAIALQKLVVEMRELQTPDAPAIREGYRPLHLETLVWTIANEWRQVATASNLTLDVLIEYKGIYVLGDERRLRWAIGNILDNAVKYTPPGGKMTLEIQGESDGKANLRVRDNGVGIMPDDLPNVFTRFYRGTPTTEGGRIVRVPGTGQGLSAAKQTIEAHGGMIAIKSKPGVGTAVYFTLPVTASVSMELPHLKMDMEGETVRLNLDDDEI